MRKPATLQDHGRDQPRQPLIQEAESIHAGLITAAMLVANRDIDSLGMNCSETRREWIWGCGIGRAKSARGGQIERLAAVAGNGAPVRDMRGVEVERPSNRFFGGFQEVHQKSWGSDPDFEAYAEADCWIECTRAS